MSKVKLSEFDRYGTFRLTKAETAGIADLVQKIDENEYLSRNARYYPTNWHKECLHFRGVCAEYERLNSLLPMRGKPAFVICEKMHELATRVVNTIQQTNRIHLFQDGKHFDTVAQKCAQECANNLVRLLHDRPADKTATSLRDETRLPYYALIKLKITFADNKKQLYMCANALPDDTKHLLTPGRGSAKLGTLVQAVRRQKGLKPLGFTQIYYSFYGNKQDEVFPRPLKHLPKKVLVMDDIICNGNTLSRIKDELTEQGHQVTSGAVTAAFDGSRPFFQAANWADDVDIVPNQYANFWSDQRQLSDCLRRSTWAGVKELTDFLNDPNNGDGHHTADHLAMRTAETKAHALGADLYQVSAKISPAAVAYNQKIRAQVERYNDEFQNSLDV